MYIALKLTLRIGIIVAVSTSVIGCSTGERRHLLLEAVLTTPEHKALVANPKMLVGKYYEVPSKTYVAGSVSYAAAMEVQVMDQASREEVVAKYSKKGNFDEFKANNLNLNDGLNAENAKANLLMKVIDGKSSGPRSTAVEVLVLNKKYAGYKLWMGSEIFLASGHEIPCPISDPSALEFSHNDKGTASKTKAHAGATHLKRKAPSSTQ
jgi:hypothetical protein